MATFSQQFDLAVNQAFLDRVKIACYIVALAVVGEAPVDSVSGHVWKPEALAKRHYLGTRILNGMDVTIFSFAICSFNTTLDLASTDNDIQYLVGAVFSDIAGVTYSESQSDV